MLEYVHDEIVPQLVEQERKETGSETLKEEEDLIHIKTVYDILFLETCTN